MSAERQSMGIKENVKQILSELPPGAELVAAAKTKTPQEIMEAVAGGVRIVGENYVQEAEAVIQVVGSKVAWHFIGHLQRNKVKKAVELFDMIETVDSLELAAEIDKRCSQSGKMMPVLIEVNSGREVQKAGVMPEEVLGLIKAVAELKNIRVEGLMTMGSATVDADELRKNFRETKQLFDQLKQLQIPNVEMKYLSMGMTDSYKIALEEGANMVRIGSKIFGARG
ncbi:MAG: YggS family pyridoxal phosphate-dependent enzyme [Dehalococcoidales bacterium]|nr:YggS family pyridoxal phosphate-dependent enzyme [Dehalococcoidales bacterium]